MKTRAGGLRLSWNLISARFIIGQAIHRVRSVPDENAVIKHSPDWDNLVTGSLDVSIKSVVVSPSFLSADAG